MRRLFPLVFTILLLQGCAPMAKAVFGIYEISDYRPERVETFHAEAQRVLPCEMLVSDSAQYARMVPSAWPTPT